MKVQTTKKKRKPNQFLPVMGLLIAVCMGVIAYLSAPYAIDLVKDFVDPETRGRMNQDAETLEYAFTAIIWFILFSVMMFMVAVAIGEDPDKEERLLKPPPNASAKELKQYYKKLEQLEKKRMKQAKEIQRRNQQK